MPPKKSQRQRTLPELVANGVKWRAPVTATKHIVADTSSSSLSSEFEDNGKMWEQGCTPAQAVESGGQFDGDEEIVTNGPNEVIVFPVTFEQFLKYTNCAVRVKQIIKEMWHTHKRLMEQEQQTCTDLEGKWSQLMYERFYTHPLHMRERANLTLKKCTDQMRKKLLARATIKVLKPEENEDNSSKALHSIEHATVRSERKKRKRLLQKPSSCSSSESDTGGLCLSRRKMRATVVDGSGDESQLNACTAVSQPEQMPSPHEYVISDSNECNSTEVRSSRVEEAVTEELVENVSGDNVTVNLLQFITEPDLISSSAQFPVSFHTFMQCSRQPEIVGNFVDELKSEYGIDLSKDEVLKDRIFKNYYKQFYTNPSIRKKFPMIFKPCPTCVKQNILREPHENAVLTALPNDTNENVPVIAAPSTEQCMEQQEPVGDRLDDNPLQSSQPRSANTIFLQKSVDEEFISKYIQARRGKTPEMLSAIYERIKNEVLHQQSDKKAHEKEKVQILSVKNLCGPCPIIATKADASVPVAEDPIRTVTNVERAKALLSHNADKLHTLSYLLRYHDGIKRDMLSAIMQMTVEEFQRYTHVYGAPDIYNDVEALRYCYAIALVEPRVWPVLLFMRLVDLHQYLQSKQVEYDQLDLQHVSPKLLHWEELSAITDFDECVRLDYYKCTGETLSSDELLCERRESFYRRCWTHDQWLWQTPIPNESTLEQLKATTIPDLVNQQGDVDMNASTASSVVTLQELSSGAGEETENDESALSMDMDAGSVVEECTVVKKSTAEDADIDNANGTLEDMPSDSADGKHNQDLENELVHVATPELANASERIETSFPLHSTIVPGTEIPHFDMVDMPNTQAQIEALLAEGNASHNAPCSSMPIEEDRLAKHPSPVRESPAARQAPLTSSGETMLSEFPSTSTAVMKQETFPLKALQFNLLNDEDHFECVPAKDDVIVLETESIANCCFGELTSLGPIMSPADLSGHQLQSQFSFGCFSGSMTEGQRLPSSLGTSQEHTFKQQTETEKAAETQMLQNVPKYQQKEKQMLNNPHEQVVVQMLPQQDSEKQREKQNSSNDAQQMIRQSYEQKKGQREQHNKQQRQKGEMLQLEQQDCEKEQQQPIKEEDVQECPQTNKQMQQPKEQQLQQLKKRLLEERNRLRKKEQQRQQQLKGPTQLKGPQQQGKEHQQRQKEKQHPKEQHQLPQQIEQQRQQQLIRPTQLKGPQQQEKEHQQPQKEKQKQPNKQLSSGHQLQSQFSFGCFSGSMTEGQRLPSSLGISQDKDIFKQQTETEKAAETQMLQREKQNSSNDAQQMIRQSYEQKKEQRDQLNKQQKEKQQPKEQQQLPQQIEQQRQQQLKGPTQLKGPQQQEKEHQQPQKEKQKQPNKLQQLPQQKEQQLRLLQSKKHLHQQKQELELPQQKTDRTQLQQQIEMRRVQQKSGAIRQSSSSKSLALDRALGSKFITGGNAIAPAKSKRKPVDAIVPQLTHEFRALQLLVGSDLAKVPDATSVPTPPMVRIATAISATVSANVQGFDDDTSLFNNTSLVRKVDQSKPQSPQPVQHHRQPAQPAQQQLQKQVNYKTNAVDSTSGRHQTMVYRKLEFFDYFGQLTVEHIEQYQLHSTGIGQPYMRARIKCANGRRTFVYGDVLGALFARCPAPLLRDMQRLLEELGEYHYTSRKIAYASRHVKASCEDLRASVMCQFMRSASIFTYAYLRPDCEQWQRVELVNPVTDKTLARQPHCSDLSAALFSSTLARIEEFKSRNRAPL